jgi:cation diffusion facilitator family transporter
MGREELKAGERAVLRGSVTKAVLAVVKGVVGFATGSLPLLADAVNSGVDVIVTGTSWISLRISQRNADRDFPFGYYKVENLASLMVAVAILVASVDLLIKGVRSIDSPSETSDPLLVILAASASAIISFLLARYLSSEGRKSNSPSLNAIARDTLSDALASSAVVVAVVFAMNDIPYAEGVISVAIALLILRIAYITGRDAVLALLDVSPDKQVEEALRRIALATPGVRGVGAILMRKAGPVIHGTMVLFADRSLDVHRANDVAMSVERAARNEMRELESLIVRMEPFRPNVLRIGVPSDEDRGLGSRVSGSLGRASYIHVVEMGAETRHLKTLSNPGREREVRSGLAMAKMLCEERLDSVLTAEVGEIAFHSLRDCFIDLYRVEDGTVREAVERMREGVLKRIDGPTKESGE